MQEDSLKGGRSLFTNDALCKLRDIPTGRVAPEDDGCDFMSTVLCFHP